MADQKPEWAGNQMGLLQELRSWVTKSIRVQRQIPWMGGHDEGTFTRSWCGYYLVSGDARVLEFMRWLRDSYLGWSRTNLVHGYAPQGEAHHGTENHCIFLTRLWHLDRGDEATVAALEDAAHHAGNWVEGIPEWYDWEGHRFRSWRIGTGGVREMPPDNYEVPDHFKILQFTLVAYLATGKERYLALCRDYADRWTDAMLAEEEVPCVFVPVADPAEIERLYPQTMKWMSGSREVRVELHVAAGSLDLLMELYALTGEVRYLDAVRRTLDVLIDALSDPYAETAAMLLSKYRVLSGGIDYDAAIMERISSLAESPPGYLTLLVDSRPAPHPMGIVGRRRDEVRWGYRTDGMIAEETGLSSAARMLAYQITGEERYAAQALGMARDRMRLARISLKDGRDHGCGGNTISSVASGHGRAAGVGTAVATLAPSALGAFRFCEGERVRMRFFHADGEIGLPEGMAALFGRDEGGVRTVQIWSDLDRPETISISPGEGEQILHASVDSDELSVSDEGEVAVSLPPRNLTRVSIGYRTP